MTSNEKLHGGNSSLNSAIDSESNDRSGSGFRKTRQEFSLSGENATLSFHDINYIVQVKEDKKKVDKYILKDTNGIFSPGMNAILGPTGCGKTSLLNVLAARKDPTGLQGSVLIDGQSQPADFKLISGYVVQDDVVMGTLSVRENLAFSAALRLPSSLSKEEKSRRVEDVISDLGLKSCADTKIGSPYIRGVSGGERKRTNIGMELIIKPSILFLDEPTTGLDASTANAVMLLLSRLSRRGHCIVFSIHQPRYSIFRVFDTLHLLCKGETVYHGPANQTLEYFASIGYQCEAHNNPPDFFLDILNEDSSAVQSLGDVADEAQEQMEMGRIDHATKTEVSLVEQFKNSSYNKAMTQHLQQICDTNQGTEEPVVKEVTYPTSAITQLLYLCGRNGRNILRNPQVSAGQIIVNTVFALLIGTIYFNQDMSATSVQNRVGAFFFIATNVIFGNTTAVEPFIEERVIFLHESASGFYRVSSYFLSKIVADLFPLRFIPITVFAVISYWMIGFKPEAGPFFMYTLNLLVTSFAACAIAFIIGASVGQVGLANLFITVNYVIMMIFGGLLVNIASLPEWLRFLQYLSVFRYSMNFLYINELSGRTFCDPPVNNSTFCIDGDDFLTGQGIDHSSWGLWQNQFALIIITIILMFLTYVQLRRMPKLK